MVFKQHDHILHLHTVLYAEVLTEGSGGRSKGCGIVEFSHPEEAARAIEELQNSTVSSILCENMHTVRLV